MLGSRRSSVTLAAGKLAVAGMIEYRRGHIVILERLMLQELACECYHDLKNKFKAMSKSSGYVAQHTLFPMVPTASPQRI